MRTLIGGLYRRAAGGLGVWNASVQNFFSPQYRRRAAFHATRGGFVIKEAWFWGRFQRGDGHCWPLWVLELNLYLATRCDSIHTLLLWRRDVSKEAADCVSKLHRSRWRVIVWRKQTECVHFQVPQRPELCFFSSVPSQPVPPLSQTLQGYLKALEPLLPPEELSHTRRMVQEFGRPGGLGSQLQEGLERRAMLTKNWVCVCVCCFGVGNVTDGGDRYGCVFKARKVLPCCVWNTRFCPLQLCTVQMGHTGFNLLCYQLCSTRRPATPMCLKVHR